MLVSERKRITTEEAKKLCFRMWLQNTQHDSFQDCCKGFNKWWEKQELPKIKR